MYHILILFAEPSDLTVNITEIIMNLSVVVQWDEVDDSLPTIYRVTWTSNETNSTQSRILIEQSSYTITGLTLDTVYIITVTASNGCGQGPEYITSVSLTIDATSTTSAIPPIANASTNTITPEAATITATSMQSSTTTTTTTTTSAVAATATTTTNDNTATITISNTVINNSDTNTANIITTTGIVISPTSSNDTDTTGIITTTSIVVSHTSTTNPAARTMAGESSKFLST